MDAQASILATVSSRETGEFETSMSHLTSTTAFIETMHAVHFGEAVELRVSDLVVKAEVVFVADAPMGWVVRFDPSPELMKHAGLGAEEAGADIEIEDPITFIPQPAMWGDPTPTYEGPPVIPTPNKGSR